MVRVRGGFPLDRRPDPDEEVGRPGPYGAAIAYPKLMARRFMLLAIGSEVGVGTSSPACGARVQLDPSLDVTKLGLSPAGVLVAKALGEDGAYVVTIRVPCRSTPRTARPR